MSAVMLRHALSTAALFVTISVQVYGTEARVLSERAVDPPRVMYIQLEHGVDLDGNATHVPGLECLGIFDTLANVHVCRRSEAGSETSPELPLPGSGGILCTSWEPSGCALSSTALSYTSPLASTRTNHQDRDAVLDGLTMTYEQCMATLPTGGKTKTLSLPLEWLHIPKCGTSFGATVYGYLCTANKTSFVNPHDNRVNCTYCGEAGKGRDRGMYWDPKLRNIIPFSNKIRRDGTRHRFHAYYAGYCDWSQQPHPPYSNHFALSGGARAGKTAALTMLRDPRKRLVSAWNNDKHSYGAPRRDDIKYLPNITAFVQHPAIQGCQAKMLIGRPCADGRPVTEMVLEQAKVALEQNVAWFGLTDVFNMSVCLFHHEYGGVPQPYMFDTVGGLRSSKFLTSEYRTSKTYKPLPGGGERVPPEAWRDIKPTDDPMDMRLFAFARKIFIRRLRRHGLLTDVST